MQPWDEDVFDTIGQDQPPDWMNPEQANSWREAHALRLALDAAIKQ
jgi:hypothetical protein